MTFSESRGDTVAVQLPNGAIVKVEVTRMGREDVGFDVKQFQPLAEAIEALGGMGDEVAIPALLKALEDGDFCGRAGGAEALGKLDDQLAIPALLKALETQEPIVCEAASVELARLGSPIPLSQLWQICLTSKVNYLRWIATIQNHCKFYNYEIWQEAIQNEELTRQKGEQGTMVWQATGGTHETPHYVFNTEVVQVIEQNYSSVIGKQSPDRKSIGDQPC